MRRLVCVALCVLLLGLCGILSPSAEESREEAVTLPSAYAEVENAIPPALAELLPDGLFSPNAEEALTAASELTGWQYLLRTLLSAVGLRLEDGVSLLATLTGLILLAAILGRLRESLGGQSGELFGFCLRLTLFTAIIAQVSGTITAVQRYLESLSALTGSMIPVMGVLYALGGDLGRAAVNSEILGVFLVICQYVSGSVTPPVCAVCTAFSLLDAIGARALLAPLCEQVKRWYVSLLGIMTFLFSLALSTQSVLVSRGDSLSMKGIKYAVGNMIPMVGGAVAGTLSTVAAGVSALRGICGVSGVILVALLLLPTLVELLLLRGILSLAATVASALSCEGEAKLLRETASLQGYLVAAVALCSVIFLLALTLMTNSVSALAP